ncbi:hypothetical protein R5R35_002738 [Gryllus longicercus]|uniref:Cytochrome P450 n=1 Tax=Gryllus longicercus TaxID=2509291 RepID=A0AAN9VJ39_9ORTH
MIFLLLFTVLILYILYSWITLKPQNFPPGPPTVPILGSIPFLPKKNGHFDMENWRDKYGGAVGLALGSFLSVVVCEPKLVREVLKRDEFQARPYNRQLQSRSFGRKIGIMFADGPDWQEQRRFSLRHLKEFGFGKTSMESSILDEAADLMDEIRDRRVQVSSLFNISSVNVLWKVMAGVRFKRTDPLLQRLIKILTDLFRAGNGLSGNLSALFPILRYVLPFTEQDIVTRELSKFILESIREHDKTLDEANPRDFIDVYLTEMRKHKGSVSSYDEETLIVICMDLFSAGAESVGNTLGFIMLYMVLYPKVQQKVHEAIDSCIGRNRKPSLLDRPSLPYIEAVIQEVIRCNTIAPTTVPHSTFVDTELNGYFVPKDTFVLLSLWSISQDKEHWGDPENFRPSRFIDESGKLKKDEFFIPFGYGKRLCPGEALARNFIFLMFTTLMQDFSVELPPGHSSPSTVCLPGFTTAPQPFEVIFKSR